jgi:hypothetical protein
MRLRAGCVVYRQAIRPDLQCGRSAQFVSKQAHLTVLDFNLVYLGS